jgi:hypothetical protein
MTRKTDKECAQTLVAAAIAAPNDASLRQAAVERNLTTAEMVRGAAYIESGKTVRGSSSNG